MPPKAKENKAMSSSNKPHTLPSCDLYDLVVDMNWNAVIEHAENHPQDAQWQDFDGRDGGETPLYLACQCPAPVSAIQSIIAAYPEALRVENRNGNVPLHVACHYNAQIEILNVLIEADPATVFLGTKWGKTPLNALYDGIAKRSDTQDTFAIDDESWEKMKLLLRAVASEENLKNERGEWLLLHAAVSLGAVFVPEIVFDFTMKQYSDQTYQRDSFGRLPLHIVVGATRSVRFGPRLKRHYKPRERHVFECLLKRYPEAARDVNEQGRWPLHTAIVNGHAWDGGVELLCLAAPEAIAVVDPVTGLLPFFLAGVPLRDTGPSLTTIFQLVCFQPHLLGRCRPNLIACDPPDTFATTKLQSFRNSCKSLFKETLGWRAAAAVAVVAAFLGTLTASSD